ncbi:MAG TPA: hypothetical protein VD837_09420 [Terriglobales bacterium]|nr:hypothetical protein [Terriglobales bacterium]
MKQHTTIALFVLLAASMAYAGGPLIVGSPVLPNDGEPLVWNVATMPITYTVDPGPLAKTPNGTVVLDNAAGRARVQSLFAVWQAAPDAALTFSDHGLIQVADGDVNTIEEYNAISCTTNPIIFDANGSLFDELVGDPLVIGFAGPCAIDTHGHIAGAHAALNGRFQDGLDITGNSELTSDEFDTAFIHEFGHFLGLDHSQINGRCLTSGVLCSDAELGGMPTMFPILIGDFMKSLATDDLAWISKLYPKASFSTNYGTISGTIFFSDGITPAQGVNVIARRVDDPTTPTEDESRTYAVSVVSGYRFTGNPGQSLTAHYLRCSPSSEVCSGYASNNVGGSSTGSRSPSLYGYFEMAVPPGNYTIEVESVRSAFTEGSSVGPLDPPVPMPGGTKEFWNDGESATDSPSASTPISVPAGGRVDNINVILNNTAARNDSFETGWLLLPAIGFAQNECEVRG